MAILGMRVYGVLAGCEKRKDQKTGLEYEKVTVMGEDGKKMELKVMGPFSGLGGAGWGDKLTVDIDSPRLIMANYGDTMFECANVSISKPVAPVQPTKASA